MKRKVWSGTCNGGPMDGQKAESRFPEGFLLVDKPEGKCWLYDWDSASGTFKVRDEKPMVVQTEGLVNRYRAADEFNYDVLAAPWVGGAASDNARA